MQGGIDPNADDEAILEFCTLNIQSLILDGKMMEDSSMNVEIGLKSFTMDDQRINSKIRRLMDKKDAKSTDNFIELKYNQNTSGDKFGLKTRTMFIIKLF